MLMEQIEFHKQLTEDGYTDLKWLHYGDNVVYCGLFRFAFTVGLLFGIDEIGYRGRWCFHTMAEAKAVLDSLEAIPEDHLLLPGEWVKYKGEGGEQSRIKDKYDTQTINAAIS